MKFMNILWLFQLSDVEKVKHVVEYFAGNKVKLFEMLLKKWKTLQEMTRVLRIPYNATIAFQNPFITLSDAYAIWTKMTLHLEACAAKEVFKTKLPQELIIALNERKLSIFTEEMECCLYLDPRFRRVILDSSESTARAEGYLINLWNRISSLPSKNETSNASSEFHVSFDETSEFNRLLSGDRGTTDGRFLGIEEAIQLFQPDLLSPDKSVLEFWKTQKNSILYNLAMAVYSIPPTQAKIEQNFSSVGHIFTERRFQLSRERLSDILMINLNKELFKAVKKEELDKTKE